MSEYPIQLDRMALVNIDMQVAFVEGTPLSAPKGRDLVDVLNPLIKSSTKLSKDTVLTNILDTDWKDRLAILDKFSDDRLVTFGHNLIFNEAPELLPKDIYKKIKRRIASRILSTNKEKWNTIPRTYSEIDTLRNKFKDDKDKLRILEEINSYIEEMEKMYQKAS